MQFAIVKRIVQSFITLFAAITLGFLLIHQLPTGPWTILQALYSPERLQEMDPRTIERISKRLFGFDPQKPLYVQYIEYWKSILTLNFGTSIIYNRPVYDVLAPAIPWSVFLGLLGVITNTAVSIGMGGLLAYREGSRLDVAGSLVSVVLQSVPYYVFAILLLIFLGFQTPYFPTGGRYGEGIVVGFNLEFMLSALHHAILPVASLSLLSFASLGWRAHAIRVMGSDYIRVARLRGLAERRIVVHYVLRNSVLPFYSGLVTIFIGILGGSVITEFIFQYVGLGWYLFRTAAGGDIPMVLATFAFFTITGVLTLLFVDFTYHLIDPRAEGVGTSESF